MMRMMVVMFTLHHPIRPRHHHFARAVIINEGVMKTVLNNILMHDQQCLMIHDQIYSYDRLLILYVSIHNHVIMTNIMTPTITSMVNILLLLLIIFDRSEIAWVVKPVISNQSSFV